MKLSNVKLPIFRWSADWGQDLTFKLKQIIDSFTYISNQYADGYLYPTTSVTTTYNANVGDTIILANGTFTVTLPSPATCKNKRFAVKNTGAGTITVAGITGNIDGAANIQLTVTMESVDLVSDGTDYWVI
jgi:hypothetical protein